MSAVYIQGAESLCAVSVFLFFSPSYAGIFYCFFPRVAVCVCVCVCPVLWHSGRSPRLCLQCSQLPMLVYMRYVARQPQHVLTRSMRETCDYLQHLWFWHGRLKVSLWEYEPFLPPVSPAPPLMVGFLSNHLDAACCLPTATASFLSPSTPG